MIEDDRIAAIGSGERRGTVIDAEGLVAVPGFVDIHSHVDWIAPLAAGPELLQANVRQGITTSLAGNCGISPAPLGRLVQPRGDRADAARRLGHRGPRLELELACASTSTRSRGVGCRSTSRSTSATARSVRRVLGEHRRAATPTELAEMGALLVEGLDDGAVGLSVGLEYFPGRYAGPSEVEGLARIAAAHDALVAVHTRGISELFDPAMDEALGFAAGERLPAPARAREPDGTRELGRDRPALRQRRRRAARPASTSRSTSSATRRGR